MNEKIYNMETEELFKQLEEAGWHPMWCDTEIDVYDNPVSCGKPEDVGDIIKKTELYPSELMPPHRIFMVPAKGDSMRDAGIEAGDMLTIESCVNIYDDDMVLVRTDGDFLVKAFYEDDDGSKWLVPYNDKYEPIRLGDEQVYISGRVIEITKRHPRVRHRDSSSIVNKAKKKRNKPKVLTREELKMLIAEIAPTIETGRLWFSVYRPLVQYEYVDKGNYAGCCSLIWDAVPEHKHLPSPQELQRMDVQSFTKIVALWDEQNAPVRGKRFMKYKMTGEKMLGMLSEKTL